MTATLCGGSGAARTPRQGHVRFHSHMEECAGDVRDGSVRNLQELYTVAVGMALTLAITRIVPEAGSPVVVSLPNLVAYVVTLVPHYNGAMRHLDVSYRGARTGTVREGAPLVDFFLLFIEACLFLALASAIKNTAQALWTVLALFAVDGLWRMAASWIFAKTRRS